MTEHYIDAAAATERLKVRKETLYAYVSRGLVRTHQHQTDPRARLYAVDDISALITKKQRPRRASEAAAKALDWGLPTLVTAISSIEGHTLRYRGRDALEIAENLTFEAGVNRLLAHTETDAALCPDAPPSENWRTDAERLKSAPPLHRALSLMPQLLSQDLPSLGTSSRAQDQARKLIGYLASALVPTLISSTHMAGALATAWGRPEARDHINRALILCMDHEMNASTFAARVTASTGAGLTACLLTGLATLSGPRHGGALARVVAFHQECASIGEVQKTVRARLQRGDEIPGFAHPLYPQGDPRADAIFSALPPGPDFEMIEIVRSETGLSPAIDFALVSLERHCALPNGAATIMFALGRSVGWLAHAMEQQDSGQLIRPRARFVTTNS